MKLTLNNLITRPMNGISGLWSLSCGGASRKWHLVDTGAAIDQPREPLMTAIVEVATCPQSFTLWDAVANGGCGRWRDDDVCISGQDYELTEASMKSCFVGGQRVHRRCNIVSSEVQRFAMCLRYVYVVVHLNLMA